MNEIVRIEGLSKTFPGTKALDRVDIAVRSGEVHALLGHNGSGKSTLIKVLAGYHAPDPGGRVFLDGTEVSFDDVAHGKHGSDVHVNFVHQDLGLVLELNTIDNLALHGGFARTRLGRIDWREQVKRARQLMAPFDTEFDVTVPLSKMTPVERTIVAVAGALQGWTNNHGALVLDEPTAVLPPNEVGRLLAIVRSLRDRGAGILYVSHRLDEVFEIADRVTVLRNGRRIITRPVEGLSKQELVEHMLGADAKAHYHAGLAPGDPDRPAIEVRNLSGRYLRGVSFEVRGREVLGIAGLPADGRDELPRLLTDAHRSALSGEVRVASVAERWERISNWAPPGVALLPADRGREGVLAPMTVGENIALSSLGSLGTRGRLSGRKMADFVNTWIGKMTITTSSPDAKVTTLSGGNQQKVMLGRVLAVEPKVLVMCEPTAGVDVGARQAIYELVAEQVRNGLSVVVASSDVSDLEALCTRVIVLHQGRVVGELEGDRVNEADLLHAMEGSLALAGAVGTKEAE